MDKTEVDRNDFKTHSPLAFPPSIILFQLNKILPKVQAWKTQNTLPSFQLWSGPRGVGKKEVAQELAKRLTCKNPDCSLLASQNTLSQLCSHLPDSWMQLDFIELRPEVQAGSTTGTGTIKIETIRELKAHLGVGPSLLSHKWLWLEPGEALTLAASQALLKLAEEPPAGWILLVETGDVAALPPTLVSRAVPLSFEPLPRSCLTHAWQAPWEEWHIHWAQGSWERWVRGLQPDGLEAKARVLAFVENPSQHFGPLMDWALEHRSKGLHVLELLEWVLLCLVQKSLGIPSSLSSSSLEKEWDRVSLRHGGKPTPMRNVWLERWNRLRELQMVWDTPLNRKGMLQALCLEWIAIG